MVQVIFGKVACPRWYIYDICYRVK